MRELRSCPRIARRWKRISGRDALARRAGFDRFDQAQQILAEYESFLRFRQPQQTDLVQLEFRMKPGTVAAEEDFTGTRSFDCFFQHVEPAHA